MRPYHLSPITRLSLKYSSRTAQREGDEAVSLRSASAQTAALQRAVADPRAAAPATLQALQHRYGNRAVQRLIQARLLVGPANDRYEQEAEAMASRVLSGAARGRPARSAGHLQRAGAGDGFEASPAIESRLSALKGHGAPLPTSLRSRLEDGLNANFQAVRVHADGESFRLNRALQAQAFTHGTDIYMGEGQYDPGSSQGQKLLAHELTHVVQQTGPSAQREAEPADGRVQRFPANVLTTPINWAAQNFGIRQSASGAMGGVNFLTALKVGKGEISSVAVKGLTVGEGEQVKLGETALTTLGENVPNSRQVRAGTPEFVQLAHALDYPLDEQGIAHTVNHRAIQAFLVMESLAAKSLGDILDEAKSEADIDQLVNVLIDTNLLRTVGRLAVFDTAIGNFDRITSEGLNFGNIMISDPEASATLQFWAIDTAANLPKLEAQILDRVTQSGGFDENTRPTPGLLKKLMDTGPEDLAARFVDGLSRHMLNAHSSRLMNAATEGEMEEIMQQSPRVQQLSGYLADSLAAVRGEMIALICQGYHTGVERLVSLMSAANKASPARQALKAEARSQGAWETFKAHTQYIELRARHGLDHATAAEYVKRYAQYRVLRGTDLPAPTAANPTLFAGLEFPAVLLKSRPLLAKAATKQNIERQQSAAASRFYQDLRAFVSELDKQNDDLRRLQSPAEFSLNLMREELRREAAERRQPGRGRGAVAPADAQALKRKVLLMQKISGLYRLSLAALACAEVYKLKGQAFVPSLLKLKGGNLRAYGPSLAIQVGNLFKQMESLKVLQRRLEVHAG